MAVTWEDAGRGVQTVRPHEGAPSPGSAIGSSILRGLAILPVTGGVILAAAACLVGLAALVGLVLGAGGLILVP